MSKREKKASCYQGKLPTATQCAAASPLHVQATTTAAFVGEALTNLQRAPQRCPTQEIQCRTGQVKVAFTVTKSKCCLGKLPGEESTLGPSGALLHAQPKTSASQFQCVSRTRWKSALQVQGMRVREKSIFKSC